MNAAPPRSGSAGVGPPATPAGSAPYECDCPGFRENQPAKFCLRCLEAWVSGLPSAFSGERLNREMRKAASILMRRLNEDPKLGRLSLNEALTASERVPATVRRP